MSSLKANSQVIKNSFVNPPYEYSIGYKKASRSYNTLEEEREYDKKYKEYLAEIRKTEKHNGK